MIRFDPESTGKSGSSDASRALELVDLMERFPTDLERLERIRQLQHGLTDVPDQDASVVERARRDRAALETAEDMLARSLCVEPGLAGALRKAVLMLLRERLAE